MQKLAIKYKNILFVYPASNRISLLQQGNEGLFQLAFVEIKHNIALSNDYPMQALINSCPKSVTSKKLSLTDIDLKVLGTYSFSNSFK